MYACSFYALYHVRNNLNCTSYYTDYTMYGVSFDACGHASECKCGSTESMHDDLVRARGRRSCCVVSIVAGGYALVSTRRQRLSAGAERPTGTSCPMWGSVALEQLRGACAHQSASVCNVRWRLLLREKSWQTWERVRAAADSLRH
jgi:hypothetical protein